MKNFFKALLVATVSFVASEQVNSAQSQRYQEPQWNFADVVGFFHFNDVGVHSPEECDELLRAANLHADLEMDWVYDFAIINLIRSPESFYELKYQVAIYGMILNKTLRRESNNRIGEGYEGVFNSLVRINPGFEDFLESIDWL
ncbi:MAG: hypothetical protein LBQ43_02110 [Holosporales bacterium]|jgi:hypothetical protein|nr:hypothetical protein [Holosporales bacterium]